ncbi:hypothetical protein EBT31_00280 [bacterium]|nr:hypothetical protein [bacterium]
MEDLEAKAILASELGDENAPAGTKPWAIATVGIAHDIRYRVGEQAKALRRKIDIIEKFQAHSLLGYQTFEELCIRRLSLSPEQVKAIKDAAPGISIAVALGSHGGDRKSGKAKAEADQVDVIKLIDPPSGKGGTSREYLTSRLDRDHPTIAAEVHAGTLSARAGAIRAGIIRELSPLEKAQAAFRRLAKEDRDAFDLWRAEQPL